MKEEFKALYEYIINSNDEEKMRVLGQVTKSMMCRLIEKDRQTAREYLDILQSVKWNNYMTETEVDTVIKDMTPSPAWSYSSWKDMIVSLGLTISEEPYYNEHALFVTMSMITSDSGDTIKEWMNTRGVFNPESFFKFVYALALDKLKDKDGRFDIRKYFNI